MGVIWLRALVKKATDDVTEVTSICIAAFLHT